MRLVSQTVYCIKIGENIKHLRMIQSVTQKQLSDWLGVTPQAVSRWECGATLPDMIFLPMLARFFDVTIDALFGYEKDKKSLMK